MKNDPKFSAFMDTVRRAAAHAPPWAEELEKRLIIDKGSLVKREKRSASAVSRQSLTRLTIDDIAWLMGTGPYGQ